MRKTDLRYETQNIIFLYQYLKYIEQFTDTLNVLKYHKTSIGNHVKI